MQQTTNFGLQKPEPAIDNVDVTVLNGNVDKVDELLGNTAKFETAGGTGTAITLTLPTLVNGLSKTFIASSDNNGADTTINTKPTYKPGTTNAPTFLTGKAYTVWYDAIGDCFFIKASAEGTATADKVLAPFTFSNGVGIGIPGTIPSKEAATITPGTANQIIAANQFLSGIQTILGDPDLIASNIPIDLNLFGIQGTRSLGKSFASGTVTSTYGTLGPMYLNGGSETVNNSVTVSGLSFKAKTIICYNVISSGYFSYAIVDGITGHCLMFRSNNTNFTAALYSFMQDETFYINDTGFRVPYNSEAGTTSVSWIAYGE